MKKHERNTAKALNRLLDGKPPNGAALEDFGPHASHVKALRDAYAEGGPGATRRAFVGLAKDNPRLADLLSSADIEKEGAADPLVLDAAPPLHEAAYKALPKLLTEALSYFKVRHERDVLLTGALAVLSGCLPNLRGFYGHNAEALGPNLYAAIVAGAAGGKGPLRWAERLSDAVDEKLRDESERARKRWEAERKEAEAAGEEMDRPRPPKRSLILPANTSAAAFHEALRDREGRAVLVETEIDTLVNALGQEWGKFDDTLRKAFHHERVSYLRKGENDTAIPDPHLALVLSGTERQFAELIGSAENGLYSRFALYYFESRAAWIDQRPPKCAQEKPQHFEELSRCVLHLYEALAEREEPLWFKWTESHWDQHAETFAPMLRHTYTAGVGHLGDVVKRAGVVAFRASMTLCALRAFERGADLGSTHRIEASDADVNAGLALACTYADHALRFGKARLSGTGASDAQAVRIGEILRRVEETFTNADVYAAVKRAGLDVSRRQLRRDLKAASRRGLIENIKRGHWRKA